MTSKRYRMLFWAVSLAPLALVTGATGCGETGAAGDLCGSQDCSGHGTCEVVDGAEVCQCDTGYAGAACADCAVGYTDDGSGTCVLNQSCETDDPCGDHGTCDDSTGDVVCQCDTGYDGQHCQQCYPGYHDDGGGECILDTVCLPSSCAGHGTCDDSTGVVECTCDLGYAGDHCGTCDTGYHRESDDTCVVDEDCAANDPCGMYGTCDDSTGVIECICDDGYTGANCDACYPGYHDDGNGVCVLDEQCLPTSCAGNGTCDDTGGVVSCTCDAGYAAPNCYTCDVGYHLESGACVVDEDCAVTDPCGDNGTCVDTTGIIECVCDTGYAGTNCDTCYPGYQVNVITGLCEVPCQGWMEFRCNGQCIYAQDQQNCGACGNDCGGLQCLSAGSTFYCGCPSYWPWSSCTGQCANLQQDPNNCGTCGTTCDTANGEICFAGNCVVEDPGCWCTGDPEWLCCSGNCLMSWDLQQDPNNCGSCGNVCTPGVELCVAGTCQSGDGTCGGSCNPNWEICCNTQCMDIFFFSFDSSNCGSCGNVCGASSNCQEGHCVCNPGTLDCGAGCTDILADEANCGGCGITCNAGDVCVYGTCGPDNPTGCGGTCGTDEYCCTLIGPPYEECVDILSMDSNPDHCGGCQPCAQGEMCTNGICNCPYMPGGYCSGVCTDFWSNTDCGGCGIQCNPNEICEDWGMGLQCICPWLECGGVCTNTEFDELACGDCTTTCNAGEACVAGDCVPETGTSCDPSCADQGACCDMGSYDQCLYPWDLNNDINNCGGCGIQCTGGNVCVDSICGPPPGNDCNNPQVTYDGGGQMYNLCQNTPSGFTSSTCPIQADGTQYDRFHLFTIPFDTPMGWMIDFFPFGLMAAQAEVWMVTGGSYCDNAAAPVGCIDAFNSIVLDPGQYPAGTEIIIFVYNANATCDQGDYDLMIWPM